jgi:hypothetical protein
MKNVSFKKKVQLYLLYRKTIKENKEVLQERFSSRVDKVYRIYGVVNIPREEIPEPYNIRKKDLDIFSEKWISEYIKGLSTYLNSLGLGELVDIYGIKKVDKYSYLVITGYKLFRTDSVARDFWFKILPYTMVGLSILGAALLLI